MTAHCRRPPHRRTPTGAARCSPATTSTASAHWAPLTPAKWEFPGDQIILTEPGTAPTGPRRPFEYAVLRSGPALTSLCFEAEVRLDESTVGEQPRHRDDLELPVTDALYTRTSRRTTRSTRTTGSYYAHISQDNTIYPHNGIFVVDNADRRRIDDQWNGSVGAPPAVDDMDWHDVGIRYDARTGAIGVHVDGADEPLMTATDTTFRRWPGRLRLLRQLRPGPRPQRLRVAGHGVACNSVFRPLPRCSNTQVESSTLSYKRGGR